MTLAAGRGWAGGGPPWLGSQPVTFSVEAQAPMVEPELTEVGELHSLTDWQVSEASEEAELDEFCSRGGPHKGTDRIQTTHHQKITGNNKIKDGGGEEHAQRDRDRQTDIHRRGKDERSRALGLFFPKAAPTQRLSNP